ncbi:IS21 family transposase, partial [bacterium]|nr:IS21 family transposase [bacterium]
NLSGRADKEYISILRLSAKENETAVDEALRSLIDKGSPLTFEQVEALVRSGQALASPCNVEILPVDLSQYDSLLPASGRQV